jgi:hypothetical protein
MPLNDAQTGRFLYVPLAQETEQFSSKESVVGANPTRDAWSFYSIYKLIEGKSLLYPYEVYHTCPITTSSGSLLVRTGRQCTGILSSILRQRTIPIDRASERARLLIGDW